MREKRESALGFDTKKEGKKNILSILGFITHDAKGNNHNRNIHSKKMKQIRKNSKKKIALKANKTKKERNLDFTQIGIRH